MTSFHERRSQRGAALIMVLWVALFLALILAIALSITRTETRITAAEIERLKADQAARGALRLAMYRLATDGQRASQSILPLTTVIGDYEVTVRYSPEMDKLDVNLASEQELTEYFSGFMETPEKAAGLVAQIMDWRDEDDLVRINGAERRDYAGDAEGRKPGNRPFLSVSELSQVLDMKPCLLSRAASGLTVFGGRQQTQDVLENGPSATRVTVGIRISLEATATTFEGSSPPYSLAGVFLISGNRQNPFEHIYIGRIPELKSSSC